jgi:hypothetical protein
MDTKCRETDEFWRTKVFEVEQNILYLEKAQQERIDQINLQNQETVDSLQEEAERVNEEYQEHSDLLQN